MRLIVAVYEALRSFARPATRREIEREAGLTMEQVRKGLDGLNRRAALVVDGAPRQLTTYALKPNAARPVEGRGRKAHGVRAKEGEHQP